MRIGATVSDSSHSSGTYPLGSIKYQFIQTLNLLNVGDFSVQQNINKQFMRQVYFQDDDNTMMHIMQHKRYVVIVAGGSAMVMLCVYYVPGIIRIIRPWWLAGSNSIRRKSLP